MALPSLEELDALNAAATAAPVEPTPVAVPQPAVNGLPSIEELDALNAAATATERPDDVVNVQGPDGSFGTVNRAELPQAVAAGYTPADDAAYARAQEKEYNESTLGQAQTVGEQFVEGGTLGLAGLAAKAIAPEYAEKVEHRVEDNPILATGANIGGAFLPGFLTGGASAIESGAGLAARGAGAVLRAAPAALSEAGAKKVGAYALKKLGGEGAGVVARALAGGAEAASEAAISTAVQEASKRIPEVIANPEKWGEQLTDGFDNVATSALISGGIGSVLGGLGGVFAKGAKGADELIAARLAAKEAATPSLSTRVADDTLAEITGELKLRPLVSDIKDAADNRSAVQKSVERVRAAEGGFEETQQNAVRSVSHDFDDLLRDQNQIDEYAGLAAKTKGTKFLEDAQQGFAIDPADAETYIDTIVGDVKTLQKKYGKVALTENGGNTAFSKVLDQAEHSRKAIREAAAVGDLGTMHDEMSQLNRIIGKASNTRNTLVSKPLRDFYDGSLKNFLQDEDYWGSMAVRQKAINPTWSERIGRSRADLIQKFFVRKSGEAAADPFEDLAKSNSSALGSFFNQLGDAEADDTEQALRLYLRASAADATARAANVGGKELQDRARNIVQKVARIEEALDKVKITRMEAVHGRRLLSRSAGNELLGAAVGTVVPGAGFLINGLANIKKTFLRAAAEHGEASENVLNKAVGKVLSGTAKAARGLESATGVARTITPKAVTFLSPKKHDAAVQQARELSDPQSDASLNLQDDASVLDEIQPGLGTSYARAQVARANFIASKLPPEQAQGIYGTTRPMDPISERKLKKYVTAAYAPTEALVRIASGEGHPEDLETIKKVYPALYSEFQKRTEAALRQSKKKPPYDARVRIQYATGLDLDGTDMAKLQGTADGNAADAVQEVEGGNQPNPGKDYQPSIDPNKAYGSRSDNILARG